MSTKPLLTVWQNKVLFSRGLHAVNCTKPEALELAIEIMQTAIAEGWINPETLAKMQAVIDEA